MLKKAHLLFFVIAFVSMSAFANDSESCKEKFENSKSLQDNLVSGFKMGLINRLVEELKNKKVKINEKSIRISASYGFEPENYPENFVNSVVTLKSAKGSNLSLRHWDGISAKSLIEIQQVQDVDSEGIPTSAKYCYASVWGDYVVVNIDYSDFQIVRFHFFSFGIKF